MKNSNSFACARILWT